MTAGPLSPALADRARRLRDRRRRVKDIAAELGVSVYAIKMATTPGFAERQREHHRRTDERRAALRKADPAIKAYKADHYRRTKDLSVRDASDLADRLIERRRQRGLDQGDAARQLGVTLTTYQTWEAGRCPRTQIRIVGFAVDFLEMFRSARPSRDAIEDAKGGRAAQDGRDGPGEELAEP